MFSKKRQLYICEDCRNEFAVEHKRASRRIYLSYGVDEHSVLAMHLKRDLEARGHEVWYDPDCARKGEDREKFVETGLDWVTGVPGEGRFVVVLTPTSVRRPDGYCLPEIAKAVQRKLIIIPVMASFCEPPLNICRIQWLDMMHCHPRGDNEDEYLKRFGALVEAIEGDAPNIRGAESRPLNLPEPPPFDEDIPRTSPASRITRGSLSGSIPVTAVERPMSDDKAGGAKNRIFISYGHDENMALAIKLKEDLAARGHEVWFDADKIKTGTDWEHYIDDGLNWTAQDPRGRVVLIMTPHSVRRPDGFCLNEIARAVMKNISVMPIMLVWCEPPLSICRIQWMDMMDCIPVDQRREKYDAKFQRLVEALEHDRIEFEGHQSMLFNVLKPISFDSEVRYNVDRFVGRAWVFEAIDRWLADESASRVFWITGGPGVGKTMISAYLCAHRPEIVAFHFCRYDNVQKRDPRRAVMSIAYQLSTQLPEYEERLQQIKLDEVDRLDAKTLFDHLIVQPLSANYPAPDRNIAILIDAMDEATEDGSNELAGLIAAGFERTPLWLRLIVTSRPHAEVMGPLQAYTPFTIDILDARNDRDIVEYLTRELGRLKLPAGPDTIKRIAEKSNGLFLYAEYIVAELHNGRLSVDRLDEFPQGLGGIYHKLFERQFPDIDDWEERICPGLEVIAAAMEPISLKVVGKIFGWNAHEERRFKKSLGSLFSFDQGTVPFHKSVIDWLSNEDKDDPYFISPAEGQKLLADYGWKEYKMGVEAMSAYARAYLPAHLIQLKRWADVGALLTDLSYYEIAYKLNVFDVLAWWSRIEEKGGIRIVDAYRPILADPAQYGGRSLGVAHLLYGTGHYGEASVLYRHLIDHFNASGDRLSLKDAYEKMGLILNYQNRIDDALTMLKRAEGLCRELGDSSGLQDCLAHQIVPMYSKGDWESINRNIEEMLKQTGQVNKRNLTRMLHMKGLMQYERGNLDEALATYLEKEKICREIKDPECLIWTLNMKANTLYEKGDFRHSLAVSREMEKICRDHGHKLALKFALINLGDVYYDLGEIDEAVRQLGLARELCSSLGVKKDLDACLSHLSVISYETGDLAGAAKLHESELAICKEQNDVAGKHITTGNMAIICHDRGMLDEAMDMLREKERFSRDVSLIAGIETSIGNQALILYDRGDLEAAMKMHREEEQLCRESAKKKDLYICLYNQANVYLVRGDAETASKLLTEAEQEFRKLNFLAGVMGCLIGEASLLHERGRADEALRLYREAEGIGRKISLKKGLLASLGNQAIVLSDRGDIPGSLKLLKEAETISRSIEFKEGVALSLVNQAIIMSYGPGQIAEAAEMAEQAYSLVKSSGIEILARRIEPLLSILRNRRLDPGDAGKPPRMIRWELKKHKLEKK
jgi:tetratricopeptide (TPR) repeat protein